MDFRSAPALTSTRLVKIKEQAGAELYQAQGKLRPVRFRLYLCFLKLPWFGFSKSAYEFNKLLFDKFLFDKLLFGRFGFLVWFSRFGVVGFVW